jgi:DNA-binding protein HU-beta
MESDLNRQDFRTVACPVYKERVVNLSDESRKKLAEIRRIVAEENTDAFVEVMQQTTAGDRLETVLQFMSHAGFSDAVLKEIVTVLADPTWEAGTADLDEIKGLCYMIQSFVKASQRREALAKTPFGERKNVFEAATQKLQEELYQQETTRRELRLDQSKLIAHLATKCNLSQDAVSALLQELVELAIAETNASHFFEFPGLGAIAKVFVEERTGRNPQTGENISIPARTKVVFRLNIRLRALCGDDAAIAELQS